MAIQISGTTVIDNSRNLTNIESVSGNGIATQSEAEAGTNNNQVMTPLRVSQAISALASGGSVDSDINWSTCNVGCSVRGGGNVFRKTGGIIWIVAPSTSQAQTIWPIGYCHGANGPVCSLGASVTARGGWFTPDISMLQTAYSCRSYWDTYTLGGYWSSSESTTGSGPCFTAQFMYFQNGSTNNGGKTYGGHRVRPVRVICY